MEREKTFKVKIVKCSYPPHQWWAGFVNYTVTVVDIDKYHYKCVIPNISGGTSYILKEDCEVVEETFSQKAEKEVLAHDS